MRISDWSSDVCSSDLIQCLRFSVSDAPSFTGAWGLPFTVLCLVGLQNAVNMADGKNGLVIGLCFIWTSILVIYAPPHLYPLLATLLAEIGRASCRERACQ